MDAAQLRRRWDFLRPLLAPVRGRLSLYELRDEFGTRGGARVGLQLELAAVRSGFPPAKVRDALLLLSLVERADRRAFEYALTKHCGLYESIDLMPRFCAGEERVPFILLLDSGKSSNAEWVRTLSVFEQLIKCDEHLLDTQMLVAMQKVVSLSPRRTEWPDPVVVPLEVWILDHSTLATNFAQALQILLGVRSRAGAWRFPVPASSPDVESLNLMLGIEGLNVEIKFAGLNPSYVEIYEDLLTSGDDLVISSLQLSTELDDVFPPENVMWCGRAFERVLCASNISPRTLAVIDNVQFTCPIDAPSTLGRLSTALAETRRTRSAQLLLYGDEEEDVAAFSNKTWEYIAYAFFSKHARLHSSITNVWLCNVGLSQANVDAIAPVFTPNDPASYVFRSRGSKRDQDLADSRGKKSEVRGEQVRGTIKKGTTLRFESLGDDDRIEGVNNSTPFILPTNVSGVQILEEDSESDADPLVLNAVVPGYGVCLVPRDQVVIEERSNLDDIGSPCGVTTLRIGFVREEEASEGLHEFLGLVGSSLTRLWLDSPSMEVDMSLLFACCPNLESLCIKGVSVDANKLVAACKHHQIKLKELECDFRSVSAITDELSDVKSWMTQNLSRLTTSTCFSGIVDEVSEVARIGQMLAKNRKVEFASVNMSGQAYDRVSRDVTRRHGEPLAVARERFPISCQLAFISVVGSCAERGSKRLKKESAASASFAMDSNVLSLIFEFAAECVHREAYAHVLW